MKLNRRNFLAAAGAAAALPRTAFGAEKPYLKVGFMTDTHVGWTKKSCDRVKGAFEIFRAQGVDAIGHCGDLADWHYPDGYKYYLETYEEAYAGAAARPKLLYVYANHDALDPARKDPKLCQSRMMDLTTAFRLMRERLKIEHGVFHETTLNGVPFLVFPQTMSLVGGYEFVEKKIAETCAAHPAGPVIVMAHVPPTGTLYNSDEWGDARLRRIYDKFPRVVAVSGHTHGSLRNEMSIWQGNFTAVDACCLQEWHGVSVGTPVKGKQAYGVIVMEFYADRLVLRRFDVRGGAEFKPEAPWTVPLPFDAAKAPYAPVARARAERKAAFAPDAKLTLAVDRTPFANVTATFPGARAEEDVLAYKVELARKRDGAWERFARGDVFGEFYLRPQDRKGVYARTFSCAYFEPGETYRVTATPVGFFGAEGAPLAAEWTAPAKAPATQVFLSEKPMDEMDCRCGWPTSAEKRAQAAKSTRTADGWYEIGSGMTWLNLPAGTWTAPQGTKFRVAVDLRFKQSTDHDGSCLSLTSVDGTRRSTGAWMTTPRGESGLMRCVFEFAQRAGEVPDYAFAITRTRTGLVRVERFLVERL